MSPGARLSDEQLIDWLRLIRSENVGPRTFRQLINRYGGAAAALEALPELAARSLKGRAIRVFERGEAERELTRARALGVRFVALGEPDYPARLREIADAPPLIAVRGDATKLAADSVAIVGSRNASAAGLAMTERLARDLSRAGYVIVSGLARGIDTVAHSASLETGTIAVLAGGHARPYPAENAGLLEKIASGGGAIVSEMPLEWEPRGRDFPRRNRIVSGLCLGVIVVEAARRSGSLITARFAAEQNREIFAVPGSPLDPRAEGANDLLRQGAHLCASAEDVIHGLTDIGAIPRGRQGDLFSEDEGVPSDAPLFDELDLFSLQESGRPYIQKNEQRRAQPAAAADNPQRIADAPLFRAEPPTDLQADVAEAADPRARVISLLGPSPVTVDELIRIAGLPAREVQGVLIELDLAGRLERHGPNAVSLIGPLPEV